MKRARGGVYAIKCQSTDMIYIGATGNLAERKAQHFSRLKCGRHHHPQLQADYDTHGKAHFAWHVVLYSDSDAERMRLESALVALLQSNRLVYNKHIAAHHLADGQLGSLA